MLSTNHQIHESLLHSPSSASWNFEGLNLLLQILDTEKVDGRSHGSVIVGSIYGSLIAIAWFTILYKVVAPS